MSVDLHREGLFPHKKQTNAYGGRVLAEAGDFSDVDLTAKLVEVPEKTLITAAYIVVEEAFDATTTMTVKLGNDTLINTADVATTGVKKGTAANFAKDSGTGADITVVVSGAVTKGKAHVVIDGIEYAVKTGNYLQINKPEMQ